MMFKGKFIIRAATVPKRLFSLYDPHSDVLDSPEIKRSVFSPFAKVAAGFFVATTAYGVWWAHESISYSLELFKYVSPEKMEPMFLESGNIFQREEKFKILQSRIQHAAKIAATTKAATDNSTQLQYKNEAREEATSLMKARVPFASKEKAEQVYDKYERLLFSAEEIETKKVMLEKLKKGSP